MFLILAALGLLWLPVWWFCFRDFPEHSPHVNEAELAHIRDGSGRHANDANAVHESRRQLKGLWKFLFTNRTPLANNWAFFVFGYFLFFFMTWLPSYLHHSYGVDLKQVGLFSILPWLLAAVLLLGTGRLSDALLKKTGRLRIARSHPIWISQLLAALSIIPVVPAHSVTVAGKKQANPLGNGRLVMTSLLQRLSRIGATPMKNAIKAVLLGCLAALAYASPAVAAGPVLVLEHVTLIDGTGAAPEHDMTVIVADGRIRSVYRTGKESLPAGAKIEDLHGRYLIPGLIDAHVHVTDVEPDIAHYKPFFRALLLGGVTTVRDMAGDTRLLGYLARETNSGAFPAPDLYYAALLSGPTFFQEDRRAQAASAGEPLGFAPWMQAVSGTTDIPLAIAEAKGTGATGVKLYANLPAALVEALAAEAHRQGLRVWTHATIFPAAPHDAVDAGADTISHSPYLVWEATPHIPSDYAMRAMGDFEHIRPDAPAILALFRDMKAHGTILDATLNVFRLEARHDPQSVGKGIMPWSYAVTKLAHEHGVPIDAGTDSSGLPFGKTALDLDAMPEIHTEMALLVEHCGFTPLQAIQAATEYSAMAVGHGADRGTITPGKRADIVVLDADPVRNIHNTTKIDFVIKNGAIYRRKPPNLKAGAAEEQKQ